MSDLANFKSVPSSPSRSSVEPSGLQTLPVSFSSLASSLLHRFPIVVSLSLVFLVAHLVLVLFQPPFADVLLYVVIGLSVLLCAAVSFRLAHTAPGISTPGISTLRWALFASALLLAGVNLFRGAAAALFNVEYPTLNAILVATSGTLFILALTIPSACIPSDRIVEVLMALVFCAVRIVYMQTPAVAHTQMSSVLARVAFDSAVLLSLALLAWYVCPPAEYAFFKCALIYLGTSLVACICTNQIGYLLLHQTSASQWSFVATLARIVFIAYALRALQFAEPARSRPPQSAVLLHLMPFAMSCGIVAISALLLPTHPRLGLAGIAAGITGFLVRAGLSYARLQRATTAADQDPNHISPTDPAYLDPLTGLGNRLRLQLALACARSDAQPSAPVSLILIDIDGFRALNGAFGHGHGDLCLLAITRVLRSSTLSGSTLCRLGGDEFVILLPATDSHVTFAFADHLRTSIARLQLPGRASGPQPPSPGPQLTTRDRTLTVSAGVASAISAAEVDKLLYLAESALHEARHRGGACVHLAFLPERSVLQRFPAPIPSSTSAQPSVRPIR